VECSAIDVAIKALAVQYEMICPDLPWLGDAVEELDNTVLTDAE
jgi:hypothetical protein